ncbi:predicted protein [Nematostella vectensis]|uniref:REJ domain-containing protein n=1 Tax=Nematostella vectensis TaxID=45351 RepID=A7SE39_NEMVE|nr:predicted protein [Nematostella vectensis]|eukprot:XP_001630082.1 predicted protein [Nematostella vectensis]
MKTTFLGASLEPLNDLLLDWDLLFAYNNSDIDINNKTLTEPTAQNIVFKPDALQPGVRYKLRLNALRKGEVDTGFSEIAFQTNIPPLGGSCSVSPAQGHALTTQFTVTCVSWSDVDEPLSLDVYIRDGAQDTLIAYGAVTSVSFVLPVTPSTKNVTDLKILIKDSFGCYSKRILMVNVSSDGDMLSTIETLLNQDGTVMNMILAGNTKDASQLIAASSSLLVEMLKSYTAAGDSPLGGTTERGGGVGTPIVHYWGDLRPNTHSAGITPPTHGGRLGWTLVAITEVTSCLTPRAQVADEKESSKCSWRSVIGFFSNKDDSDEDKKKSKFLFPHWCLYANYVLAFLTCFACALFTCLYGFTFGKTKSEEWISSMLVSFTQSVVVVQPAKVLLLAAFFALIIKDPDKEEDDADDEMELVEDAKHDDDEVREKKALFVKPPDLEKLQQARQLRLKQREMQAIIREIIGHLTVVLIVLFVAFANHDDHGFRFSSEASSLLTSLSSSGPSFDTITNSNDYWGWTTETVASALYPIDALIGYRYTGIMRNKHNSNVIGLGRIRQLRIKKEIMGFSTKKRYKNSEFVIERNIIMAEEVVPCVDRALFLDKITELKLQT